MFATNRERFESGEFGPGGFGGPFRARRGMMEPAILTALEERPMHGYEVIKTLEERSHGMWRPSPGSVYPTLQLLEEKDHVLSREEDGKKIYELTEEGKKAASEAAAQREHMKAAFAEKMRGHKGGRRELGDIMRMVRDIYHKGNDEQHEQLAAALAEFKQTLANIQGAA